jgi:acetylornithine deacetylase
LIPSLPVEKDGKLFGLGSNDAGGSLVSLIAAFLYFHEKENLKYNIILAATAEEEISGHNGIEALLPQLGKIDFALLVNQHKCKWQSPRKGLWYWIVLLTEKQDMQQEKKETMP